MSPDFDTSFDPRHGEAVPVGPSVLRVTANNASPYTFHGTNSYIVGDRTLAVIDPGPDDPAHLEVLLGTVAGRPLSHILVSHTHCDHSPLAQRLAEATGAEVLAEGPHRSARPLRPGEVNPLDASADMEFSPDRRLADGEIVEVDGWTLRTILTPGHAANHACFALEGTGILFSADHVMAWSTSIVAPPDGAMADYMASLDKLLTRSDTLYLPGHGGPVVAPARFVRALRAHRRLRETAIRERIAKGDRTIAEIVRAIYRAIDPRLHGAAALSVLAHLEDLYERGLVVTDGAPTLDAQYRPA